MVASNTAPSARRIRANRRNSRKSTGPNTAAGKARSCRNATGHGIFCNDLVLPGESRQMFDMLRTALIHEHRPQTMTELFFVDRMASAMWRLRRVAATEATAHEAVEQEMIYESKRVRRELEEKMEDEQWLDDDEDEEAKERKQEPPADPPRPLPASVTTNGLLSNGNGKLSTLEKLSLYEKRLEGTVHRCIRDLRKLRTSIKGEAVPDRPSPFLADPGAETPKTDEASQAVGTQVPANEEVAIDNAKIQKEPNASSPQAGFGEKCAPDGPPNTPKSNSDGAEWKTPSSEAPSGTRSAGREDVLLSDPT